MEPPELRPRLVAILAADGVGYSRLMSADDEGTIRAIDSAREVFRTITAANGGRVIDTAGDSVLAIFKTAAGAALAALAIQRQLEAGAELLPEDRRLRFRLGLHLGDVVQKPDGSVYGDGVNVAARLQGAALPGGIVASESIRVAVRGKLAANFEDIGEQTFKNIAEPVRAHRLSAGAASSGSGAGQVPRIQPSGNPPAATAVSRWLASLRKLKGTVMAVAAVGAALSGLAGYWTTYRSVARIPDSTNAVTAALPLSILVLPFANQTGDEKRAYVADALTTSITSDLSRIRDAFVVPVPTAFTYKNKVLTVQQVGKDAAVRFILEGSVVASGDNLRIIARLVDTRSGKQLWNETFQGDLANLFALQDQVTARIGNSIGEHMVIVAARESETRGSTSKVGDLIMRARALQLQPQSIQNFTEQELLYRNVLAQEPSNVNAMTSLAVVLAIHAVWFDDSNPAKKRQLVEARDLALKVKAIDPSLYRVYIPLAIYAAELNDFDGARRAYEAQVLHDPKNPGGYNNLSLFYREIGEPEKALPLLKQALALYPKGDESIFANLGGAYLALADNDAAIDWLLKAVDVNTQMIEVYSGLAIAYSNKGDMEKAALYAAEYRKRATAAGIRGIDANPVPPGTPAAYVKYYREHLLPEWKKAGLP